MARGLIPLGMNTANQALSGFTKEAQLGTQREIAGKKLELEKTAAMQGSQQSAVHDVISTAISFITFGLGGGFEKGGGTTPNTTAQVDPQMEGRSGPMAQREVEPLNISASAEKGMGNEFEKTPLERRLTAGERYLKKEDKYKYGTEPI